MKWLLLILTTISASAFSQCKTYQVNAKGQKINCTDSNNLKQGCWITRIEKLRGEPGYQEEGAYKDGKKEGLWKIFTLMGDDLAIENYKWGFKNGNCEYYSLEGLIRTESWKAIDPKNPYDTVDVYDLYKPDIITKKIVKVEGTCVKHGLWLYYNPASGAIIKQEEYQLGGLIDPSKRITPAIAGMPVLSDSTVTAKSDSTIAKPKPLQVVQYEKKNAKKKIKVRDGVTGVN